MTLRIYVLIDWFDAVKCFCDDTVYLTDLLWIWVLLEDEVLLVTAFILEWSGVLKLLVESDRFEAKSAFAL
jgi:hypothetical protein